MDSTALFASLVGFATGAALFWLLGRSRLGVFGERIQQRDAELQRIQADLAAARADLGRTEQSRGALERELVALQAETSARLDAERSRLQDHEKRAAQYLAEVEKMRSTLQTEFQAVAARLLDEKAAKFTEHNRTQVDALLHPLRQQLTDFRQRVDVVYKTDSDDRASLKAQIEQLRLLNTRITDEARALTQALKGQAQTRGAWGELILERLLESSGLRRDQDFVLQESMTNAEGRRVRPDVILRLPDDRHLVIDSKVSLVDYEQSANATDLVLRDTARRAHVLAVRRHVEELSGKRYEDAGQLRTPDYVLMFVPIEPAFTTAIEADPALYEWAFDRRVILVTAPTLLATLKTVATLWKQDRQARNVQEIARRGGLLYDKFVGLYNDLEQVNRHFIRTRESFDEVFAKLRTGRGNLLAQVEDLRALGAKTQKLLPPPEVEADNSASNP
jgi:DNA recombination protein RmuC